MLGRVISHYRIEKRLGEGGMGVVYLATDLTLRRMVAVKLAGEGIAAADPEALASEARAASRLTHPNIARIYDLDRTEDGRPFFVMEFVPGENLSDVLARGPLKPERAVDVVRSVAEALREAHAHGVVHRDIKPGNIRIGPEGDVKVLDFGLALNTQPAVVDFEATLSLVSAPEGVVEGTPGYLSPEQASGRRADSRSDLFSLGAVFYECLTGIRPYPARGLLENLAQIQTHHPEPPSTKVPAVKPFDSVVMRLLEKDPASRYQKAEDLLADLHAKASGPARSRALRLAAAAACVLAVLAAAAFWRSRPYEPRPEALRWYLEGTSALRDGTYLKASKALEESVRLDPEFALSRAHLAEAWLEMDYGERAKEEMLRVGRLKNRESRLKEADRLHLEAVEYLVTGDAKESIQRYRSMLPLVPNAGQAMVQVDLGRAEERAGEMKSAAASYREAVRLDPQAAAGHLRLGLLLRRTGDLGGAESELAAAERLYKASSNLEGVTEARYGLGAVELDREQPGKAQATLESALESARLTANVQQQVKILMQLATIAVKGGKGGEGDRLSQAAVELARSAGVENLVSRALIVLGGAYFQKDKRETERLYGQALEIARRNRNPLTEARARLALGSLHSSMGEPERSVADLTPVASYFDQAGLATEAFQARLLLGRARRDTGDMDGAEKVFRELVPVAEKSGSRERLAMAHEGVGQILMRKERYRDAAAEFEQCQKLNEAAKSGTGLATAALNRASALWRLGDATTARKLLDEAEKLAEAAGSNDLSRGIRMERTALALSESRYAEARAASEPLMAERQGMPRRQVQWLAAYEALALAGSGQGARSIAVCRETLGADALAPVVLACAEAAQMAGQPEAARTWAEQAYGQFDRGGQPESAWRATALLARSGNASARTAADQAMARLGSLWTPEDLNSYLSRADVKRLRAQSAKKAGGIN